MRFLLSVFLSVFLLSLSVFGQTEKPQTIIVPTGSLGNISEVRKKILEKTLESALDDHFAIVPKDLFEEAQEKAFEELDYEECTEEQCIMMIKEILQVDNAFQLVLMEEDGDTHISLTWNDLDQKRVEEEYCEGCKTKQLRESIIKLVQKLLNIQQLNEVKSLVNKKTIILDQSNTFCNPLCKNVIAHYDFNGDTSNKIKSNKIPEKLITYSNNTHPKMTIDRNGKKNSAFLFDGVNDQLFIKDLNIALTNDITIVIWFKTTGYHENWYLQGVRKWTSSGILGFGENKN